MIRPQEHLDQHLKRRHARARRGPHILLYFPLSATLCAPHTHCLLRSSYFTSLAPASTIPSFLLLLLFTHTHDPLLPRPFSTPEVLILTFRFPFQSRSSSEQPFLPSHCLSLSNLLICISPSLSWQPSSCPHTLLALDSGMALCASLPHTADSRPLPNSRLRLDWVPVPPPFLPSTSPPPLKHKGHIRRR